MVDFTVKNLVQPVLPGKIFKNVVPRWISLSKMLYQGGLYLEGWNGSGVEKSHSHLSPGEKYLKKSYFRILLLLNSFSNLLTLPMPLESKTLKASFSIFIPSGSFTFVFIPVKNSWENLFSSKSKTPNSYKKSSQRKVNPTNKKNSLK